MSLQEIFDSIVSFVDNLLGVLFSYDWSWVGEGQWETGFWPFILFFFALYFKQQVMPTLLLWSIFLTYFQFLIVSALTFAVSCTSSSAVLPTIAGLFVYLLGNLTEYLNDVAYKAGQTGQALDEWIGKLAKGLYYVLPNLRQFSLKDQILYLPINDPPRDAQIPQLVLYGLIYAACGYILAYWIFRRKEF